MYTHILTFKIGSELCTFIKWKMDNAEFKKLIISDCIKVVDHCGEGAGSGLIGLLIVFIYK